MLSLLGMALTLTSADAQRVGTIDQAIEAWYPADTELIVTATSFDAFQQVAWRGDTNTAVIAGETLTVSVDGPLEIDVVFIDRVTENTRTPWWFLAESDPERDWTPQDFEDAALSASANGAPLWESYVTGMDPENPEAVFAISQVMFHDGTPRLNWRHDRVPPQPITVQFRASLLEGEWQNVGTVTAVDGENTFESAEGERGFYRLVVEVP